MTIETGGCGRSVGADGCGRDLRQRNFASQEASAGVDQFQIMVTGQAFVRNKLRLATDRYVVDAFENSCPLIHLVEHRYIKHLRSGSPGFAKLRPEKLSTLAGNLVETPAFHVMPAKPRENHGQQINALFLTPYLIKLQCLLRIFGGLLRTGVAADGPRTDNVSQTRQFQQVRIGDTVQPPASESPLRNSTNCRHSARV